MQLLGAARASLERPPVDKREHERASAHVHIRLRNHPPHASQGGYATDGMVRDPQNRVMLVMIWSILGRERPKYRPDLRRQPG